MYRKAAIVGIGQTDYARASGVTERELAHRAVRAALADAQVEPHEVDGIIRYTYDSVTVPVVMRSLDGAQLRYVAEVPFGGQATAGVIAQAASAVASGQASVVLVYRSLNGRSGVRYGRAERRFHGEDDLVARGTNVPAGAFAGPYGLLAPAQVMALWAARYAYQAGVPDADFRRALGTVATQQRAFANQNPAAIMRDKPLDMTAYLAGRMIASPLCVYDLCLESDGAAATVLVDSDRARAMRADPVYVLSGQQLLVPYSEPMAAYRPDLTEFAPASAIDRLFAEAKVSRRDVRAAVMFDASSFMVLSSLETYGFAERGTAWRYLLDHGMGLDSPLPMNTHGGQLSEAYLHGMNHVIEAVRQLRGTAANQVEGADVVLLGVNGASSALLGR